MEQQNRYSISKIASGILLLAIIFGSLYGVKQRQQILDYLALRNYSPSQRVVKLADDTTMQDSMRRVFYVNHPDLNDKSKFRTNCPATEQSIVLGCYVERKGIYLLDVKDQRLSGVVEVTAAHEALHAEYARLSPSERSHVDQMTAANFASLNNDRIKKTIEQYRSKDPSVVPNELHSILATEVRDLSPDLAQYYARYFKNREQIVSYSERYEQTFVSLNTQVEDYDQQLSELKTTIEANQSELNVQSKQIEAKRAELDALINAGRTEAYNAAVPAFNEQVRRYNALINTTKTEINNYNAIVAKRNAIATTEQQLVEAINGNIATKQTE